MKKALRIASWVFSLGIIIFLMSFTAGRRTAMELRVSNVTVTVDDNTGLAFLEEQDVLDLLTNHGLLRDGIAMSDIDLAAVERSVREMPEVKRCEAYTTIDGYMRIDVKLRLPIVRIIHQNGMSNYLDEDGEFMPTSRKYTARVPVFSGEIAESSYKLNVSEIEADSALQAELFSDDIYRVAMYLHNDPFFSAQIEQVVVDKNRELVLIPKVGDHKIVFGKVDDLERKFRKLRVFYKEGLSHTDWNAFREINLKFDNQIVCTKK
jgi:cell division protein FtsQ